MGKKGKRTGIDNKIIHRAIKVKKNSGLKIPDAIIVASAEDKGADLFTSDEEILRKIDTVNVVDLLIK